MNLRLYRIKNNLSTRLELSFGAQIAVPVLVLSLLILLSSSWVNRVLTPTQAHGYSVVNVSEGVSDLQKKIAGLEAESMRLRAFAQKMVDLAKLDKALFAFDQTPAQGGLNGRNGGVLTKNRSIKNIALEVEDLRQSMLRHSHYLERMQLVLKSRTFGEYAAFAQWPVSKGYISSSFGMRKDPFSGRYRKHHGVDIAGPKGTNVMSIAAGKVVFSGRKGGYGRLVEIKHDHNLMSRYAHLRKILVKKGQQVPQGALIGYLGSSGRSTGPHLHLEVLKNKKHVNPLKYLSGKLEVTE